MPAPYQWRGHLHNSPYTTVRFDTRRAGRYCWRLSPFLAFSPFFRRERSKADLTPFLRSPLTLMMTMMEFQTKRIQSLIYTTSLMILDAKCEGWVKSTIILRCQSQQTNMIEDVFKSIVFFTFKLLIEIIGFYSGEILLFLLSLGRKKIRWDYYAKEKPSKFVYLCCFSH